MRLDLYLTDLLNINRSKAKDLINSGAVKVNEKITLKAGSKIKNTDSVIVDKSYIKYASRAGLKLEHALNYFSIDVNGVIALDIGASTGGFTDCLIQKGAKEVYAVDVGSNQLIESLRLNDNVKSFENTDIRDFIKIYNKFDFICCDVSFISVTKLIDVFSRLANQGVGLVILIKPQFELIKSKVGKNGIVREENYKHEALYKVIHMLESIGYKCKGYVESPIEGKSGNTEYLSYFKI